MKQKKVVRLANSLPDGSCYRLVTNVERTEKALRTILEECLEFQATAAPIIRQWLANIDEEAEESIGTSAVDAEETYEVEESIGMEVEGSNGGDIVVAVGAGETDEVEESDDTKTEDEVEDILLTWRLRNQQSINSAEYGIYHGQNGGL